MRRLVFLLAAVFDFAFGNIANGYPGRIALAQSSAPIICGIHHSLPPAPTYPGQSPAPSSDGGQMPPQGISYYDAIVNAANAYGIEPCLLAAIAAQETGGPTSNSGSNIIGDNGHGRGVFQIDDRAWPNLTSNPSIMDPNQNAMDAAAILSDDLRRYGGDVHMALSAYNAGDPTATGTMTEWPDGEYLGYADSVLKHLQNLGCST